jgi:hypothetical protein
LINLSEWITDYIVWHLIYCAKPKVPEDYRRWVWDIGVYIHAYRITVSRVHEICTGMKPNFQLCVSKYAFYLVRITSNRNLQKFVKSLTPPKDLSFVPAVRHGIINEPVVLEQYKQMKIKSGFPDIIISKSGFLIDEEEGWLGASPDFIAWNKQTKLRYTGEVTHTHPHVHIHICIHVQ